MVGVTISSSPGGVLRRWRGNVIVLSQQLLLRHLAFVKVIACWIYVLR